MYDQPHDDFDEHEHGEDASSTAYDAAREYAMTREEWCAENPDYAWTWDRDEHPEEHDGPCACLDCRIYAAED